MIFFKFDVNIICSISWIVLKCAINAAINIRSQHMWPYNCTKFTFVFCYNGLSYDCQEIHK